MEGRRLPHLLPQLAAQLLPVPVLGQVRGVHEDPGLQPRFLQPVVVGLLTRGRVVLPVVLVVVAEVVRRPERRPATRTPEDGRPDVVRLLPGYLRVLPPVLRPLLVVRLLLHREPHLPVFRPRRQFPRVRQGRVVSVVGVVAPVVGRLRLLRHLRRPEPPGREPVAGVVPPFREGTSLLVRLPPPPVPPLLVREGILGDPPAVCLPRPGAVVVQPVHPARALVQ